MNFWQFLKNLFRKKTEDNPFYKVRAEHEQIARELDEWKKREIMRSFQAQKSGEEFKREINAETYQGKKLLQVHVFGAFRKRKQSHTYYFGMLAICI